MKKSALSLLLTLISFTPIGCASTAGVEAVSLAVTGPNGEKEYSSSIAVSNKELARDLAVVRVDRRDIGGLVKSAVSVTSRTPETLALQYRWVWYDSYGMEVASSSQSWQPLMVYGGQTTSVQGLAPNASVKDFKLHVRYQD
jgi:uncharacterized protein YcfL